MTSKAAASRRLVAGIVALLVALVLLAGARLMSNAQLHAYDRGATPQGTYRLTAGKTYQLSAAQSVGTLTAEGVLGTGLDLNCVARAASGAQNQLPIESTKDDARNLHLFATFRAADSGRFHIACNGLDQVFVDDADDAARDYSGLLTVLASVLGAIGVALVFSGGYRLSEPGSDRDEDASERARVETAE
ncbi:hypothetical protein M6D93_07900 [Jatrophihabitans telluris]|uniref:Uncharacterized protein n=1 Tax=Jatrophihabitans telluris TaxID=2038343 RepID=A0ABY4R369_9ACTN|nr:hypothetical protein [Jatrophihabitans telluris]UQX89917.1 hypothetical protein M6D93_07900 [Jatrophihabitans telluris]